MPDVPADRNRSGRSVVVVLTLSTIAILSCLTLTPTGWVDEVMIAEYGRCALNPETVWSAHLNVKGEPAVVLFSLYCATLWSWMIVFGKTMFVARSLSVLSAVVLCLLFRKFLMLRGVSAGWASAVSLGLYFDPLMTAGFFGGRADPFAQSIAITACLLWWRAMRTNRGGYAFAAGLAVPFTYFTWPTAPVVLSIALVDHVVHVWTMRRLFLRQAGLAVLGAIFAVGIYLCWFWPLLDRAAANTRVFTDYGNQGIIEVIHTILQTYKRAPWVLLAFVFCIVVSARRRSLPATLITVLVATMIAYLAPPFLPARLRYVLPVAYLFMAEALTRMPKQRYALAAFCGLVVIPSCLVGIVARMTVALYERETRDYSEYERQVCQFVPPGAVTFGDWSCYYFGLRSGWTMYQLRFDERTAARYDEIYEIRPPDAEVLDWMSDFNRELIGQVRLTGRHFPGTGLAARYDRDIYLLHRRRPAGAEALRESRPEAEHDGSPAP